MTATTSAAPAGVVALPGARTHRWGAWYVTEHHLMRLKSYAQTVVATTLGTPLLYLVAFGVGIATLIDNNGTSVGGVGYLTFVAPALLCSAALTIASEEFSYTVLTGFKWNPIYEGMNATPIRPRQIASGLVLFVALRIVASCAVYYLIMWAFGAVPSAWGPLAILAALGTGLAFGTPLMAYVSSLHEDGGRIAMVMRFVVVPMTLFSGTMFPLDQLPGYLRWIGWISPLWHGSELAREASYAYNTPGWETAVHIAALVVLAAIGWVLAARIMRRRLDR